MENARSRRSLFIAPSSPAAAAVNGRRDAHPWCGSRVDFEPGRERINALRPLARFAASAAAPYSTSSASTMRMGVASIPINCSRYRARATVTGPRSSFDLQS